MMPNVTDTVANLSRTLDARQARALQWERRYAGEAPISFLPPRTREKLQHRLTRLSVPFDQLIVDAIVERLVLQGFSVNGEADLALWELWQSSAMDDGTQQTMRDALITGAGYACAWVDQDGNPAIWPESSSQCVVQVDPVSRSTVLGFKRWTSENRAHATLFTPTEIFSLTSNSHVPNVDESTTTAVPADGWTVTQTRPNPVGRVPLVRLVNPGRLVDYNGVSELAPTSSLIDAVTKLGTDLMTVAEEHAAPSRYVTGYAPGEDDDGNLLDPWANSQSSADPVDPVTSVLADPWERSSTMILENEQARVGQLPGADLSGYTNAISLLVRQIAAAAALPPSYLGLAADSVLSADSQRASEAALVAKVSSKQRSFGRAWSDLASMVCALKYGGPVDSYAVEPIWNDPATRSEAQSADAALKLFQSGLLSREGTLRRMGLSPSEIDADTRAMTRDAVRTVIGQQGTP